MQPSDALAQVFILLLQIKGRALEITLLAAHAQQMNQTMVAVNRGNDKKDQ